MSVPESVHFDLSVFATETLDPALLITLMLPGGRDPPAEVAGSVQSFTLLSDTFTAIEFEEDVLVEFASDVAAGDLRPEDADLADTPERQGMEAVGTLGRKDIYPCGTRGPTYWERERCRGRGGRRLVGNDADRSFAGYLSRNRSATAANARQQ